MPTVLHRLPSFALPYKRFVTGVVCERPRVFLGSTQSYRQTVRWRGRELVYDDRQEEALGRQGAALAHSTVWRWLSWLGDGLRGTFREVARLIHAQDPRSRLHREAWCVSPLKYRSQPRRRTLQRALRGLVLCPIFERLFGKAVFPCLATGSCGSASKLWFVRDKPDEPESIP